MFDSSFPGIAGPPAQMALVLANIPPVDPGCGNLGSLPNVTLQVRRGAARTSRGDLPGHLQRVPQLGVLLPLSPAQISGVAMNLTPNDCALYPSLRRALTHPAPPPRTAV